MALTSSSSIADAQAQLLANITWEEDGSVSEAAAFVQAALFLLVMLPVSGGDQGYSLVNNVQALQTQVDRAKMFLNLSKVPQVTFLVPGLDFR